MLASRVTSAGCAPSFRTSMDTFTVVPTASVKGRRIADTARSRVISRAIVATIVGPPAETSRTRHPVSAPLYARLSGDVSGPQPDAVAGHGSPAAHGWA